MKKRLKKKLETKDMTNKQKVKFYIALVLKKDKRIENQSSALEAITCRIIKLVNENISLGEDYRKLEKQNMALALDLIRANGEIERLNQEINEMQDKKKRHWWEKL